MLEATVNTFIGLVLGLITGWYFERRATLSAKAQAEDLRNQLRELRESIYSVGAKVPAERPKQASISSSHADQIYQWAGQVQDASGKVPRANVALKFMTTGLRRKEVNDAIDLLITQGRFKPDGEHLEVK